MSMDLEIITDIVPNEYRSKLLEGEDVYHFGYADLKGGCALFGGGGAVKAGQSWVMITNRRVVYEAWVKQTTDKYIRSSGSIQLAKISFVGTATEEPPKGCSGAYKSGCASLFEKPKHSLRVISGGGEIHIAVPTEEEARRLQSVVDQLISTP
jgi:hypothetical protein